MEMNITKYNLKRQVSNRVPRTLELDEFKNKRIDDGQVLGKFHRHSSQSKPLPAISKYEEHAPSPLRENNKIRNKRLDSLPKAHPTPIYEGVSPSKSSQQLRRRSFKSFEHAKMKDSHFATKNESFLVLAKDDSESSVYKEAMLGKKRKLSSHEHEKVNIEDLLLQAARERKLNLEKPADPKCYELRVNSRIALAILCFLTLLSFQDMKQAFVSGFQLLNLKNSELITARKLRKRADPFAIIQEQNEDMKKSINSLNKRKRVRGRTINYLIGGIRERSRLSILEKFGEGPYRVEFDVLRQVDGKESADKFTVEIQPLLKDLPHAIYIFLEQIHYNLYNGSFIQMGESYSHAVVNEGSMENKDAPLKKFGLVPEAFYEEHSKSLDRQKLTIGFKNSESGFFINSSPEATDNMQGKQTIFGKIVDGGKIFTKEESKSSARIKIVAAKLL